MTPTTTPATLPEVVTPVRERTTPIRPSEALRLGRLSYPGRSFLMFGVDGQSACAIGAIHVGWGGDPEGSTHETRERLVSMGVVCYEGGLVDAYFGVDRDFDDGRAIAYLESRGL